MEASEVELGSPLLRHVESSPRARRQLKGLLLLQTLGHSQAASRNRDSIVDLDLDFGICAR